MKKKISLDDLVDEALGNARHDRERSLEAFESVKDALRIETNDDLNKAMLVGEKPIKLLEQLSRANEQIVRLAQIIQRREEKEAGKKRETLDFSLEEEPVESSQTAKMRV